MIIDKKCIILRDYSYKGWFILDIIRGIERVYIECHYNATVIYYAYLLKFHNMDIDVKTNYCTEFKVILSGFLI
jgi:hypothetical protein